MKTAEKLLCSWPPSPSQDLELPSDEVHVWGALLDRPPEVVGGLRRLLSDEEDARARRFRFERHRARFTVARGLLRKILGRYAGVDPAKLQFRYGARGKPSLAGPCGDAGVEFNLSHSGDLAVYAFGRCRAIGVDVERIRPVEDASGIAELLFSSCENAAFSALPENEKLLSFFHCWTRKEAFVKAVGDGLTWPLERFDVSLAPREPARLLRIEGSAEAAARWTLCELEPGEGYVGAVVAEGQDWDIRRWQWPE